MATVSALTMTGAAWATYLERPLLAGFELVEDGDVGRYEGARNAAVAERLDAMLGEGLADQQAGDVEQLVGHFARIGRFVVRTNEAGFVGYEEFDGIDEAIARFCELEDELSDAEDDA